MNLISDFKYAQLRIQNKIAFDLVNIFLPRDEYGYVIEFFWSVFSWIRIEYGITSTKAYSEPCQISKIECFAKTVLLIFAKHSILDAWLSSEYASVFLIVVYV